MPTTRITITGENVRVIAGERMVIVEGDNLRVVTVEPPGPPGPTHAPLPYPPLRK